MSARVDLFAGILPFLRTAEARSFNRAAVALGVTTAAVSKAVRKLEEDLGVKLLDRSSRVVTLTREGAVFLEHCRQAVLSAQGARDAALRTRREPQGELSVTLSFVLAPFVVPNLARLSAQYPRLSFRLNLSDRLARLADESYDVAVRMGTLEDSSLMSRRLRQTRWITVGSPAYLARHPAPRTLAELAQHNCLRFVGPNGRPRDWTFAEGRRAVTVPVHGNLLIDHGTSLLSAAEAGMGLCQVLDFMVGPFVRDGTLIEVLPEHASEGPSVHALMTRGRAHSANVRAFVTFLVDAFQKEQAWRSPERPRAARKES